jgi:kanamycin kinase
MSIPGGDLTVPDRVRELAGSGQLEPVWRNELGGLTFRVTNARGTRFVKYGPRNAETTAAGEAARLAWAFPYTPVPAVVEFGSDATHEWLVTRALPGTSAVSPRWLADPAVAVRAIGAGLRMLHDALPVDECPFEWSVADRIASAGRRGILVPDELRDPPGIDRLVVCHGDACAPNTLLAADGSWAGHVDLGALGVGDRWADIAVAATSIGWNYGGEWTGALLHAYGIAPDPERTGYYQALWDAT